MDVECIQVLWGPSVEVVQGEGCAAHEPDARDLAGGAELGDEVSETGDDLITVECSARHQTLARDVVTLGRGSAGSTLKTVGSANARSGSSTQAGSGICSWFSRHATSAAIAASHTRCPVGSGPADAEIVERVPTRVCTSRGAAIDLVLDRGRENRSQFVITRKFSHQQVTTRTGASGRRLRGRARR